MRVHRSIYAVVVAVAASVVVAVPTAGGGAKQVPFLGVFKFTTSVAAKAAPCAQTRINVVGSGVATQLGSFTTVQHQCATSADPLGFTGGEYRFTTAKGDTIFGTYAGRFIPIDAAGHFSIDATWRILGGTGRFAGATGGGPASGLATIAGGTVVLEGTISQRHSGGDDDEDD